MAAFQCFLSWLATLILATLPQAQAYHCTWSYATSGRRSEGRQTRTGTQSYLSKKDNPIAEEGGYDTGSLSRREIMWMLMWSLGEKALRLRGARADLLGIGGSIAVEDIPGNLPPVAPGCKRIFLCRHGQTDLNSLKICQGRRLDPPLNDTGRRQAGRLLPGVRLKGILCSPLRRARETAGAAQSSHPGSSVQILPNLIEVDFGVADGLPQPIAAGILAPSYVA
ncbi:unnamed protein product, partial [Discosporangium mesarthrocarpum]